MKNKLHHKFGLKFCLKKKVYTLREKILVRKRSIQKQDAKSKQRPKAISNNLLEIMLIKLNDISCASQARACIFCLSSKKSTLGSSYWTDTHKPSTTIPIKSAVNLLSLTSFRWSNDTANHNRYPRKEWETEDFHYGSKSFDGILFFDLSTRLPLLQWQAGKNSQHIIADAKHKCYHF